MYGRGWAPAGTQAGAEKGDAGWSRERGRRMEQRKGTQDGAEKGWSRELMKDG